MIGIINKIIPFSMVDGPGNRTAIFLQGCNFNCIYCHNPETIGQCGHCGSCVKVCPKEALRMDKGKVCFEQSKCVACDACLKVCKQKSSPRTHCLTVKELFEQIAPYQCFIQGITVSGGECTLQEAFLTELFKEAKQRGLSCMLDTNGSTPLYEKEALLELCDGVMLDVKVTDESKHQQYIGAPREVVSRNLAYLVARQKLYEVRTVIVPEIWDNEETVREVSRIIAEADESIRYKLIKFRSLGVRAQAKVLKTPSDEMMEKLEQLAYQEGCKKVIIV